MIKVTLKDGIVHEYKDNITIYEVAKSLSDGLARVACAGELNGELVDLRTEITEFTIKYFDF